MIDLRQLRYFVQVVEEGHITRAAERLGIQQPPLSIQIRALENAVGTPLLTRHARGVSPTDAGQFFFERAKEILAALTALEDDTQKMVRGIKGTVNIGFTASAGAHQMMPVALQRCRAEYPEIELNLIETPMIIDPIMEGNLHCGILRVPGIVPDEVAVEVLFVEPLLAAVPASHPLARWAETVGTRALSLNDLKNETFILARHRPNTPGFASQLIQACCDQGFMPKIGAEVGRMVTSINLVAAGAGVAIVPASMSVLHREAIGYLPFSDQGAMSGIPMAIAYRRNASGPAKAIISLLSLLGRGWTEMSASA